MENEKKTDLIAAALELAGANRAYTDFSTDTETPNGDGEGRSAGLVLLTAYFGTLNRLYEAGELPGFEPSALAAFEVEARTAFDEYYPASLGSADETAPAEFVRFVVAARDYDEAASGERDDGRKPDAAIEAAVALDVAYPIFAFYLADLPEETRRELGSRLRELAD